MVSSRLPHLRDSMGDQGPPYFPVPPGDHPSITGLQRPCCHEHNTITIYPTSLSLSLSATTAPGNFRNPLATLAAGSLAASAPLRLRSSCSPAESSDSSTRADAPSAVHTGTLHLRDLSCRALRPGATSEVVPPLRERRLPCHSPATSVRPSRHLAANVPLQKS